LADFGRYRSAIQKLDEIFRINDLRYKRIGNRAGEYRCSGSSDRSKLRRSAGDLQIGSDNLLGQRTPQADEINVLTERGSVAAL